MREVKLEPILSPLNLIDPFLLSQDSNNSAQHVAKFMMMTTDNFAGVPWLTPKTMSMAQNNQLVRMRGMIQDMPGTEPYPDRYKVVAVGEESKWQSGKFRDVAADESEATFDDRHLFITSCTCPAQSEFLVAETEQYVSRQWHYLSDKDEECGPEKMKLDRNSVIVKCYEEIEAKLNDVYDFVGILNTEFSDVSEQTEEANEPHFKLEHPWYYREPLATLHVIRAEKVVKCHDTLRPFVISDNASLKLNVEIRTKLMDALTVALSGDRLAAEFLLCHLVSSVYGRSGAMVLGNFSLNVCGILPESNSTSNIVKKIHDLFHKILPSLECIKVSIAGLNKLPGDDEVGLLPKFVPTETRLKPGKLQLPRGSQILIDETELEAGKLDEQGVKVLTALGDIAQFQRIYYDFVYYQKEYDAEYNVLVLSDYKSLIKCSAAIPIAPVAAAGDVPINEPVDFYQMAVFLASARDAVNDFELPNEMQEIIATDFANIRKEAGGSSFTADDLSSMIVLARWLTITYGSRELTPEIWRKAKEMEQERRNRLGSFTKRPSEN